MTTKPVKRSEAGQLAEAQKRRELLTGMPAALAEVAESYEDKFRKSATLQIMLYHELGGRVAEIMEDPDESFGDKPIEKLAAYWNTPGGSTTLYNLRTFHTEFDADFVRTQSGRELANGKHMELMHWFSIMRIKSQKERSRMLDRIVAEGLSGRDVEREVQAGGAGETRKIRGGGRKAKVPTSPMAGLKAVSGMANKLVRYEGVMEKHVLDKLEKVSADSVTPEFLARLEETDVIVTKALATLKEADERLEKIIGRSKRILDNKDGSADEAEEAPRMAKKASANGNGHADGATARKAKLKKKAKAAR